jgi:hypothetical protein
MVLIVCLGSMIENVNISAEWINANIAKILNMINGEKANAATFYCRYLKYK